MPLQEGHILIHGSAHRPCIGNEAYCWDAQDPADKNLRKIQHAVVHEYGRRRLHPPQVCQERGQCGDKLSGVKGVGRHEQRLVRNGRIEPVFA